MGTSFDCAVTVSTVPQTGQLAIMIGPLVMGHLAEMLDYLATDEAREAIIAAASTAFMADQSDEPIQMRDTVKAGLGPIHLRGTVKTACGLDMWTVNERGQRVTAVPSVGFHHPDQPVTCPECLAWIDRNRP